MLHLNGKLEPTSNLKLYFQDKCENLNCQETTKAYIVSTLVTMRGSKDLSNKSLTLIYIEAKTKHNFTTYQELADWILFTRSLFPEYLQNASLDYYDALAQDSYFKCYLILEKKWKLFEELADTFPKIADNLNFNLRNSFIK